MKITFNAKIVADVSNAPWEHGYVPSNGSTDTGEPTLAHLANVLAQNKCHIELVPSWDSSAEPTLIITETKSSDKQRIYGMAQDDAKYGITRPGKDII